MRRLFLSPLCLPVLKVQRRRKLPHRRFLYRKRLLLPLRHLPHKKMNELKALLQPKRMLLRTSSQQFPSRRCVSGGNCLGREIHPRIGRRINERCFFPRGEKHGVLRAAENPRLCKDAQAGGAAPEAPGILGAMTRIHRRGLKGRLFRGTIAKTQKPFAPLPQRRTNEIHNRTMKLPSIRGFLALRPKNRANWLFLRSGFTSSIPPLPAAETTLPQKPQRKTNVDASFGPAMLGRLLPSRACLLFTGQVLLYANSDF